MSDTSTVSATVQSVKIETSSENPTVIKDPNDLPSSNALLAYLQHWRATAVESAAYTELDLKQEKPRPGAHGATTIPFKTALYQGGMKNRQEFFSHVYQTGHTRIQQTAVRKILSSKQENRLQSLLKMDPAITRMLNTLSDHEQLMRLSNTVFIQLANQLFPMITLPTFIMVIWNDEQTILDVFHAIENTLKVADDKIKARQENKSKLTEQQCDQLQELNEKYITAQKKFTEYLKSRNSYVSQSIENSLKLREVSQMVNSLKQSNISEQFERLSDLPLTEMSVAIDQIKRSFRLQEQLADKFPKLVLGLIERALPQGEEHAPSALRP